MYRSNRRLFFFSSRRRHTRSDRDWSSDVCSSDLGALFSLTGAGFSDPNHDGPWTVTIEWGDGTSDTRTAPSEGSIGGSHSYPVTLLGHDYQLTVTVVDAHGARGSATKTVHVVVL